MSTEVQMCTPDDSLRDAGEAMGLLGVGILPVADKERLLGMISDRDIAVRGIGKGCGPDSLVKDVMSTELLYCFEDQTLEEVAANMGDQQIRRLPVLNRAKRLVGIVSLGDLAQFSVDGQGGEALSRISRPTTRHAQA